MWYKNPKSVAVAVVAVWGLAVYAVGVVAWLHFAPESFLLRIAALWGGGQ